MFVFFFFSRKANPFPNKIKAHQLRKIKVFKKLTV